jgi:hypothetical protein
MTAVSPAELWSRIGIAVLALLLAFFPLGVLRAGGSTNSPAQPVTNQPATAGGSQTLPRTPTSPAPQHVLEPLANTLAAGILGAKVQGPQGEAMGLVVDVIISRDGQPDALVIDFGGFLGVGTRKIAIDWRLVHFKPGAKDAPVMIEVSRDDLQAAPEYDPAAASNKMIGPAVLGHPAPANPGG